LGYILVSDSVAVSYHFYVIGPPKAAEFGRIPQNNGYYTVQGQVTDFGAN